jgi:predicted dehydrogenase
MAQRVGVAMVGVHRAAGFFKAFQLHPDTAIVALCDTNADALAEAGKAANSDRLYTDYEQMLDEVHPDAVLISTPMQLHATQAIAALQRGIHVMSEVTAGVSLDECRALVETARKSAAIYMMAENYCYEKQNVLVREMIRRGVFGEVYYAEGEYIHCDKALQERTPWRRIWHTGIDGITYPTHSLGPILQWMAGDRVARLCCEGSGHHYRDSQSKVYENSDSCVMLCKMVSGGLVKIRVDLLSERPHAMRNYSVQGTSGSYESSRNGQSWENNRVWLAERSPERNKWDDLSLYEAEFLPDIWRNPPEAALRAGHGGGDYFVAMDFADAILGRKPAPIGIDAAMDMTLPGLLSQQSILQNGDWLDVPDSRQWGATT